MNIFVGNLSRQTADADLRQAFEAFGAVSRATVITDKFSGESKGFGFVEMDNKAEAEAAISGLSGKELQGRTINVSEARPRPQGGGGGGREGGGNRGGGGGRGGYGGGGGGGRRSY